MWRYIVSGLLEHLCGFKYSRSSLLIIMTPCSCAFDTEVDINTLLHPQSIKIIVRDLIKRLCRKLLWSRLHPWNFKLYKTEVEIPFTKQFLSLRSVFHLPKPWHVTLVRKTSKSSRDLSLSCLWCCPDKLLCCSAEQDGWHSQLPVQSWGERTPSVNFRSLQISYPGWNGSSPSRILTYRLLPKTQLQTWKNVSKKKNKTPFHPNSV